MRDFDFESVFGEDYLHFYEEILTDEVSDRQVETIAKLVEVGPGVRILDCPCGHGRIANRLARRGAEVVGVDSNATFLEAARKAEAGVDYRLGDMRSLAFEDEFDLVVNVFTSFGYYDDDTDRAVLAGFRRALKPGGKLVMDHQNSHRILSLIASLGGESVAMTEKGDDLMIDRNRYDPVSGRTLTERISVRGGKVRRYPFSVRVFTPAELTSWLQHAGFREVRFFDPEGEPFTLAARRMWVVATA